MEMSPRETVSPAYLSLASLATYSGLSRSTLRRLLAAGALPYYKPRGGKILISVVEFDEWLVRHRVAAGAEANAILRDVLEPDRAARRRSA